MQRVCAGGGLCCLFRRFSDYKSRICALTLAIEPAAFGVSKGKPVPGKEADGYEGLKKAGVLHVGQDSIFINLDKEGAESK